MLLVCVSLAFLVPGLGLHPDPGFYVHVVSTSLYPIENAPVVLGAEVLEVCLLVFALFG